MQSDTDRQIFHSIMDELNWDSRVCAVDIVVDVTAGIVHLSGAVPDTDQRLCAEAMVKMVAGVRSVQSSLRVESAGMASGTSGQNALVRRIHQALSGLGCVNAEAIQVCVEGGWVKLSGLVGTQTQRQHWVWMLQKLLGIREVMEVLGAGRY